jgi:hypothetical protein
MVLTEALTPTLSTRSGWHEYERDSIKQEIHPPETLRSLGSLTSVR